MLTRQPFRPQVCAHLDDFGISGDLARSKIQRLSGGQKCRLVLAAAMWSKPHMIALDEPTVPPRRAGRRAA
jgi:ATPase subunit of ABC transporter with duplicated ATPase domains